MYLLRTFIHTWLHLPYLVGKITGTGAFGRLGARPVSCSALPSGNRLKAALCRHHVKQFNEAACSVATVATVVNAIREVQGYRGKPVTQMELLDTVHTAHWKQRMHGDGYKGRRGLPLALLGQVVRASLDAYAIAWRSVEAIGAARPGTPQARRAALALGARLRRFETHADVLVIAHFDQGAVVPALNIPHISPVGGFDCRSSAVTILDVDTDQDVYQVPFETFLRAISSRYHNMFRPFGYGRGGYVDIRID